jgi:hypothetical protein
VQKSVRNHKEGSRTKSDVSRGTSTKSRCSWWWKSCIDTQENY